MHSSAGSVLGPAGLLVAQTLGRGSLAIRTSAGPPVAERTDGRHGFRPASLGASGPVEGPSMCGRGPPPRRDNGFDAALGDGCTRGLKTLAPAFADLGC